MKDLNNKHLGLEGEKIAFKHLKKNGFKILEKNFTSSLGECDIIALKNNVLIIVEVKTRKDSAFDPLNSVTRKKQNKLKLLAQHYIKKKRLDKDVRFDVIGIILQNKKAQIEHIENAFL